MVDHRADDERGLRFLVNSGGEDRWDNRGILDRVRDWADSLSSGDRPHPRNDGDAKTSLDNRSGGNRFFGDIFGTNRLAVALSAIWTGVLVAYAIGYFTRLGAADEGVRVLPTLDLVFFVFAIVGPLVMIWFAVAMLNRAAVLSESITGQSESALALAATIDNLNDSVDALTSGTTGRLEQACDRMERETAAGISNLDKALTTIAEKLETALLDGVILMDTNLRERAETMSKKLSQQQSTLSGELQSNMTAVREALEAETKAVGSAQRDVTSRLDDSLSETSKRLERGIKDLTAQQKAGLVAASDSMEATANRLATSLAGTLAQQIAIIDGQLKTANSELTSAASETSNTLRNDLGSAIKQLRSEVDQMHNSLSANPPATSEDLAALMGEAVHRIISPERSALTQSVLRITALEEQARELLDRLDRTSRLAPMLEGSISEGDGTPDGETESLFTTLPSEHARLHLNWTAVVHVLNNRNAVPGTREVIQQTLQDPDISDLIKMRDAILNALGDHGLFAEDILTEHNGAAVWVAWARGERNDRTATLAGVKNDVSRAIARGWLRQSAANRVLALRFQQRYQNVLERAVADIGVDGRIVELADTSCGRLFMLLGGISAVFTQRPMTPAETVH
ncbi:MAG: hypothetical protein AAF479_01230 [Pseudomonadota bacterium]